MADIARDDGKDRAPSDHIDVHASEQARQTKRIETIAVTPTASAGDQDRETLPQPLEGVG